MNFDHFTKILPFQLFFGMVACLFPLAFLFSIFLVSIPYEDDLAMLPILNLPWNDPFWWQSHNEHYLLVHKFFIKLFYILFQSNYIKWGLLFNLSCFFFFFGYLFHKTFQYSLLHFFIALALISAPSMYENVNWLLCSSQHLIIFVFLIGCIYFLTRGNSHSKIWDIFWGIVCFLLTVFSSGNGILTFLIVSVLLAYRRQFYLMGMIAGLFILINLYFPKSAHVQFLSPLTCMKQFLYLISSPYGFLTNPKLLLGMKILFLWLECRFLYQMVRRLTHRETFSSMEYIWYSLHFFALGNLVFMAAFRSISPLDIPDRYRIYILFVWLTLWYFHFGKESRKAILIPTLVIVMGMNWLELDHVKIRAFTMFQEKKLLVINATQNHSVSDSYYRGYFSTLVLAQHRRVPFTDCSELNQLKTKWVIPYFPFSMKTFYLKREEGRFFYE